jgi:uncharacterized protein (DUF1499 family)
MLTILGVLLVGLAASLALRDKPFGIERVWAMAFGSPDLGAVDFHRLIRRTTPNDALVCAPGLCGQAKPDLTAPVFPMTAHDLRQRIRAVALAEPGGIQVAEAASGMGDRYVVRTPLMRYPDTVDVLVLPQPDGKSTVMMYSRSQIGRSDLGANLARLRRWLAAIEAR